MLAARAHGLTLSMAKLAGATDRSLKAREVRRKFGTSGQQPQWHRKGGALILSYFLFDP